MVQSLCERNRISQEERRKQLEKMLLALDKTPTDPAVLEADLLRTSGMVPESVVSEVSEEPCEDEDEDEANVETFELEVPDLDDPEREPPQMIAGHEQLGDTPVVFQPQNVMTMARAGQPLSEVATQANVFIRYKCKQGKCKTCSVNIGGKWVCACQTKIPAQAPGQNFEVRVRKVKDDKKHETAAFFTPKSFADGVYNNGLGVIGCPPHPTTSKTTKNQVLELRNPILARDQRCRGFVKEAFGADPDFKTRMEREKRVEQLLAARKTPKLRGPLHGSSQVHEIRELEVKDIHPREVAKDARKQLAVAGVAASFAFVLALLQHFRA